MENPHNVEGRVSSLEAAMTGLRNLMEQAINEWSTERQEIRQDIKELANVFSSSRSVNWGWVFGGLAVVVTIVLALGNGFVGPIGRDVEYLRDNAAATALHTAMVTERERVEAIAEADLRGYHRAAMEQLQADSDLMFRILLGDDGTSGLLSRLSATETRLADTSAEQSDIRQTLKGVLGSRFDNSRGIAVEQAVAEHRARLGVIERWLTSGGEQ